MAGDREGAGPPLEAADCNTGWVGLDAAADAGPDTGTTLGPECSVPAAGELAGGVDTGAGAVADSLAPVSRSMFRGSRL